MLGGGGGRDGENVLHGAEVTARRAAKGKPVRARGKEGGGGDPTTGGFFLRNFPWWLMYRPCGAEPKLRRESRKSVGLSPSAFGDGFTRRGEGWAHTSGDRPLQYLEALVNPTFLVMRVKHDCCQSKHLTFPNWLCTIAQDPNASTTAVG